MKGLSRHLAKFLPLIPILLIGVLSNVTQASASHSWGNYHWARTSNPFTVKVIDSMTSSWDDNLDTAIADWNGSSVLNVAEEAGTDAQRDRKQCKAVSGKARACNAVYGFNGWLGLAQIWVSGNHIVKGVAKMNDSYLSSVSYIDTNRQHVICQEIGHDWGLGHQDESGADLNTCMDYSNALDNPHPNAHDYQQLEAIYAHLDSTTTVGFNAGGPGNSGRNGNADDHIPAGVDEHFLPPWASPAAGDVYEVDLGNGVRVITHVTWVRGGPGARPN